MDVTLARNSLPAYADHLDSVNLADPDVVRAEVGKHRWWHEIDLGAGVRTPSARGGGASGMIPQLRLPDLRGKTVLDVGAWDGALSFHAERMGATVTAFDLARPPTFELARRVLGSKVRFVEGDVAADDLAPLGTFDVVLCLGVVYHVPSAFQVIERVARLARQLLVLETDTAANTNPAPIATFVLKPEEHVRGANQYRPNYWLPNSACCLAMLRACGFDEVEQVYGAPPPRTRMERVRRLLGAARGAESSGYAGRAVFHGRRRVASAP